MGHRHLKAGDLGCGAGDSAFSPVLIHTLLGPMGLGSGQVCEMCHRSRNSPPAPRTRHAMKGSGLGAYCAPTSTLTSILGPTSVGLCTCAYAPVLIEVGGEESVQGGPRLPLHHQEPTQLSHAAHLPTTLAANCSKL